MDDATHGWIPWRSHGWSYKEWLGHAWWMVGSCMVVDYSGIKPELWSTIRVLGVGLAFLVWGGTKCNGEDEKVPGIPG